MLRYVINRHGNDGKKIKNRSISDSSNCKKRSADNTKKYIVLFVMKIFADQLVIIKNNVIYVKMLF